MEEKSQVNWTALGACAAVGALIIGYVVWQDSRAKDERDRANEPAKLVIPPAKPPAADDVVPAAEYLPWGPNKPTPIPFRNDGKREALVKQVILSNWKWRSTPKRPNIFGAGETFSATFQPRHYVKETGQYMLVLGKPAPAPGGGQWTTMDVAIVDPAMVGQTFVGRVTIVFDGLEQMHFNDVQLDVLRQAP